MLEGVGEVLPSTVFSLNFESKSKTEAKLSAVTTRVAKCNAIEPELTDIPRFLRLSVSL